MLEDIIGLDASDSASNSLFPSEFNESTTDGMSSFGSKPSLAVQYWLGKKYFQYILANHVLRRRPDATVNAIDVAFAALLRNYPYRQVVDELRGRGLARSQFEVEGADDRYETMVTTIGYVLIRNISSEKKDLAAILRRLGSTEINFAAQSSATSMPPSSANLDADEQTLDIALYSSALKEFADKTRIALPAYRLRSLNLQPPIWEATVSVNGREFEARGSNKREARHYAARIACNQFDIQVN